MDKNISAENLQRDFDSFINQDYLYYPKSNGIQIMHCMDGTGKYFRVYRYEEQVKKQLEEMQLLRLEKAGINEKDKLCSFYRTEYMNNTLIPYREEYLYQQDLGLAVQRLTDKANIIESYKRILEYEPVWMRADAEVVSVLMKCTKEWGMPIIKSLRYLEILNDWAGMIDLSKVEDMLAIHIENVYTFSWCGDFAYGKSGKSMEILDGSGKWEIFCKEGYRPLGEGELIVSMEENGPMPLKRFHTGYMGEIREDGEERKRYISIHIPGWRKAFYPREETAISYDVLTTPVEKINETLGNIIWQCHVKETERGYQTDLYLRPSYSGWKLEIEKLFIEEIQVEKDKKWEFVFHDTYF